MSDAQVDTTQAAPAPPRPVRQSSFDTNTLQSLEKRLGQRPDRQELEGRNILKEGNVAPALQAAREQLQKSQLQDKLDQALLQRPKPEELVKGGILKGDTSEQLNWWLIGPR
ncbi:hypothetical protein FA95DRAFT_1099439 [Auriscalpium vulgare]|uniref:Uncharacterized protein n=1 Tax=Auriscalpium vulgare TaxID=40419 RepID=A0ACB8RWW8_9AGAM|nr:hypothetical protein FA95DRAFT_1099439 [Auriscalpium vulgare]